MSDIRKEIELIFDQYRKHKYYTLFKDDINVSVTSTIDEIGGSRGNSISDQTANAAIKRADELREARNFVEKIERAVNQLPDLEKRIIELRYMCRNFNYISDYTVYEVEIPMSPNTYRKIRDRAFEGLHKMLSNIYLT